jgi:hypothetical protein
MCPFGPAKRPKRKKSSILRNLVGSGQHIESAIFFYQGSLCERGKGSRGSCQHLRPPEASSLLYRESPRAQISSLKIIIVSYPKGEVAIVSHRAVSLLSQGGCPTAITLNVAFSV